MRQAPCPCGGRDNAQEQQAGLVDRALQGHCLAAERYLATKCLLVESGIGCTQWCTSRWFSHDWLPLIYTSSLCLPETRSKSHYSGGNSVSEFSVRQAR